MFLYRGDLTAKFYPSRPGLLEAWLVLTSVKYHGNLYILIPLNQRLALTRLRATGPRFLKSRFLVAGFYCTTYYDYHKILLPVVCN